MKKAEHTIKYTINSHLPNIAQLRSEVNNSNPYFISSGNPNLKASTIHKIWWKEQYRFNDYGHLINSELTLAFIKTASPIGALILTKQLTCLILTIRLLQIVRSAVTTI